MDFLETQYLYFYLLLISVAYPLLQSFEKKLKYYKKFKSLGVATLTMMLLFIPWDIWFTKYEIWWFNSEYITGAKLWHLPIEEILFFVIIPFACVFIYEVVIYFFKPEKLKELPRIFFGFLALLLVVLAIIFNEQAYTFYNFGLTAFALILLVNFKPKWLNTFFVSYWITLVPFLLINGALTGLFTRNAVVNYNPDEIIGIRIFTIPIEDSIYNLLMFLLVIWMYEKLNSIYRLRS